MGNTKFSAAIRFLPLETFITLAFLTSTGYVSYSTCAVVHESTVKYVDTVVEVLRRIYTEYGVPKALDEEARIHNRYGPQAMTKEPGGDPALVDERHDS